MKKKIVLISPTEAVGFIADLGNGEPTHNGDRTSQYATIAKGYGPEMVKTVKAQLIEEKADLPESEWGYALHLLNDVDETDGQIFYTEHLDEEELIQLFREVLDKLESGEL